MLSCFIVSVALNLVLNKKYVLWNVGICPIASNVGHVILATPYRKVLQ